MGDSSDATRTAGTGLRSRVERSQSGRSGGSPDVAHGRAHVPGHGLGHGHGHGHDHSSSHHGSVLNWLMWHRSSVYMDTLFKMADAKLEFKFRVFFAEFVEQCFFPVLLPFMMCYRSKNYLRNRQYTSMIDFAFIVQWVTTLAVYTIVFMYFKHQGQSSYEVTGFEVLLLSKLMLLQRATIAIKYGYYSPADLHEVNNTRLTRKDLMTKLVLSGWSYPEEGILFAEFERSIGRKASRLASVPLMAPDKDFATVMLQDLGDTVDSYIKHECVDREHLIMNIEGGGISGLSRRAIPMKLLAWHIIRKAWLPMPAVRKVTRVSTILFTLLVATMPFMARAWSGWSPYGGNASGATTLCLISVLSLFFCYLTLEYMMVGIHNHWRLLNTMKAMGYMVDSESYPATLHEELDPTWGTQGFAAAAHGCAASDSDDYHDVEEEEDDEDGDSDERGASRGGAEAKVGPASFDGARDKATADAAGAETAPPRGLAEADRAALQAAGERNPLLRRVLSGIKVGSALHPEPAAPKAIKAKHRFDGASGTWTAHKPKAGPRARAPLRPLQPTIVEDRAGAEELRSPRGADDADVGRPSLVVPTVSEGDAFVAHSRSPRWSHASADKVERQLSVTEAVTADRNTQIMEVMGRRAQSSDRDIRTKRSIKAKMVQRVKRLPVCMAIDILDEMDGRLEVPVLYASNILGWVLCRDVVHDLGASYRYRVDLYTSMYGAVALSQILYLLYIKLFATDGSTALEVNLPLALLYEIMFVYALLMQIIPASLCNRQNIIHRQGLDAIQGLAIQYLTITPKLSKRAAQHLDDVIRATFQGHNALVNHFERNPVRVLGIPAGFTLLGGLLSIGLSGLWAGYRATADHFS